jgi:AraC-like DNA-binding protein
MEKAAERIWFPEERSFRILRWQKGVSEVEACVGEGPFRRIRGEGARWHYHHAAELTLFTSGEGTRFVGDHIGHFESGDLVLLGSRVPHYWHVAGASSGISVQWDFPPEHPIWAMRETGAVAQVLAEAGRGLRLGGRTAERVKEAMQRMLEGSEVERLGLLLQVLGCVRRAGAGECEALSGQAFELETGSTYREAMAEAVLYLVAHFREEVRLEALLELTGMSKSTFSRQFRIHAGRTFQEFLLGLRLQAVSRELLHTRNPVTQSALHCGFSQIAFFNRAFRRAYGCSPAVFRRQGGGAGSGD